jgi:uncharacterized protein (UPF0335 family)
MTAAPVDLTVARPAEDIWPQADGSPVDCREKLRVLRENHAELEQALRDCFDDAVLMGVDADGMRRILHAMVDALRDPRTAKPGRS